MKNSEKLASSAALLSLTLIISKIFGFIRLMLIAKYFGESASVDAYLVATEIPAVASAFLAAISWMGAMSKFPISYAYPFMSLAFVIVLILSNLFFKEPITISKSIGMGLIVLGIIFGSRS